ncbi:MAG: competence protein TfoX [Pedosphaera sp.]|nr:MAG: competence protein TfoX [Pedosphaera sp.]
MGDESFTQFVREQLARLTGVTFRRMFGGQGIYRHAVCFGILHQGRLYFKTDASTRSDYAAGGSGPFQPDAKQCLPAPVLESPAELCAWAERASTLAGRPPPRLRPKQPGR